MLCFNAFLGISEVTCRLGTRHSSHHGKSTARAMASPLGKPGRSGKTGGNGRLGSPVDKSGGTPSGLTEDPKKSNSNK